MLDWNGLVEVFDARGEVRLCKRIRYERLRGRWMDVVVVGSSSGKRSFCTIASYFPACEYIHERPDTL